MLLLFVPEFASQQFAGVVGNLSEPLFQRLALFFAGLVGGRYRRARGLLVTGLTVGFGAGATLGSAARAGT